MEITTSPAFVTCFARSRPYPVKHRTKTHLETSPAQQGTSNMAFPKSTSTSTTHSYPPGSRPPLSTYTQPTNPLRYLQAVLYSSNDGLSRRAPRASLTRHELGKMLQEALDITADLSDFVDEDEDENNGSNLNQ
jgi:hypothetical protein